MIRKLKKGSDAAIHLSLTDGRGRKIRVSDFYACTIKLFTTDENVYAEYAFRQPDAYTGIVDDGKADWLVINAPDLDAMHEGFLHCTIHVRGVNDRFNDVMYDKVITEQLNIYLTE